MSTTHSTIASPNASTPRTSSWRILTKESAFARRQFLRLLWPAGISSLAFLLGLAYFYDHLISVLTRSELTIYLSPDELSRLDEQLPGMVELILGSALGLGALAFLTSLGTAVYVVLKLARPLQTFKSAFVAFGQGDLDVEVELAPGDEFQDLASILNDSAIRIRIMLMAIQEAAALASKEREGIREHGELDQALLALQSATQYFETAVAEES